MVIRRMDHGDIERVAQIEKESDPQPWTFDDFEESLAREDGTTLLIVAEDDSIPKENEVVGFAVLYVGAGEGEIVTIAVAPSSRRRGMGRALVEALPAFAKAAGIILTEIYLEVRTGNTPAIEFYRACGFEPVGRRPRFYSNPTEDALLMKRMINA